MTAFETERLILRRLLIEDAEPFHREIYSDPEVVNFYNGGRVFTLDEVREFLPRRRNTGQFGYWTITLKDSGEVIGQVHLDPYANLSWHALPKEASLLCQTPEVHLGFAFGKRFWKQGYASEACRALIEYAFKTLRLKRLLGGAHIDNKPSIQLHQRLGYRLTYQSDDVVAVLENPLIRYRIRPFEEADREALKALGSLVVNWWHNEVPDASLHLVAETVDSREIVAHLQLRDRSVPEPSHRSGQCHLILNVAADHRCNGLGGCLMDRAEAFARKRKASLLYCACIESPDAPAALFLAHRGFTPLERFLPSSLDLRTFEPSRFANGLDRINLQNIRIATYAEIGDSPENRRRLYALEEAAHAAQPFRKIEPYVPVPYAKWENEFTDRDPTALFLALSPTAGEFIGVVTGLEWYFTGVRPDWCGKGIATALKIHCLAEAKARGIECMETENHEDNKPMLSINRKLGFIFGHPEVACIKRLT